MAKHSAKRFDTKEKNRIPKRKNKKQNNRNDNSKLNIITIIIILIIIIVVALILAFGEDFVKIVNSNKENTDTNHNSVSLSSILSENTNISPYSTKKFDKTDLSVSNLFLKYENNITVISFSLSNESLKEQDIFNFTFSLLNENGNPIITYDLSSEEVLKSNQNKDFILVATMDVSNASDFEISIKK